MLCVVPAYRSHETHILAIESDSGVFSPEGFFFRGPDSSLDIITSITRTCLAPLGATEIRNGTSVGTDVEPIANVREELNTSTGLWVLCSGWRKGMCGRLKAWGFGAMEQGWGWP